MIFVCLCLLVPPSVRHFTIHAVRQLFKTLKKLNYQQIYPSCSSEAVQPQNVILQFTQNSSVHCPSELTVILWRLSPLHLSIGWPQHSTHRSPRRSCLISLSDTVPHQQLQPLRRTSVSLWRTDAAATAYLLWRISDHVYLSIMLHSTGLVKMRIINVDNF